MQSRSLKRGQGSRKGPQKLGWAFPVSLSEHLRGFFRARFHEAWQRITAGVLEGTVLADVGIPTSQSRATSPNTLGIHLRLRKGNT